MHRAGFIHGDATHHRTSNARRCHIHMTLQDAYYEQKFENAFLRARRDAFQTFFERLMGYAYKADFMPCRPWGNQGDRKNDGFLKSDRRLFQVYGPNEMKAVAAISKITEDLSGAKEYWGNLFDKWTFVHNATDGLPSHVQKTMLDFEAETLAFSWTRGVSKSCVWSFEGSPLRIRNHGSALLQTTKPSGRSALLT